MQASHAEIWHGTTILTVRKGGKVVIGGDGLWNVHVHVDDAGAAVEAAYEAGRVERLRITYLEPVRPGRGRALVAVAHGPGVADLLRRCDVEVVPAAPARPVRHGRSFITPGR